MNHSITLDPGSEIVLRGLEPLFAPFGNVAPIQLSSPTIIAEFRPGRVEDSDLGNVTKPRLHWAFGVECGAVHGGAQLCSLAFSNFSRLEAFYKDNPAVHGTLVTCWHGAVAIWLRATGRLPRNFAVDGVHWSVSGVIPVGCPKQAPDAFISQNGQIKVLEFKQLVWSERQQELIERLQVEMEVGPPFRTGARGRRLLNLAFWAKYFTDLMPITYDPDRDVFAWGDAKVREPRQLTVDETAREFTNLLQAAAPSFGSEFPQGEICPMRVRQLVERVKVLTQQSRASDAGVLDSFLASQVVRAPGKNTTSQEFRAAFVRHCDKINRVAAPTSWFYRKLGPKLREVFGVAQRHDIERNGKKVRGHAGLALREEVVAAETDTTDGTDTSGGS